ncbi:DNA-directed RNA polymerase subunit RPC12/RpoP [Constrictibacter sp. MBR-5]|jgi:hypothetical protein|uniref:HNH endonuclease n=1 Tax=Constrictibacter sp. MBR-5 TaxID=3156467 RepID=UPI0033950CE8
MICKICNNEFEATYKTAGHVCKPCHIELVKKNTKLKKLALEAIQNIKYAEIDGCHVVKTRYIKRKVLGANLYVHRLIARFVKGLNIRGKVVCHSCDNPQCINPDHLFVGSYKDNSKDAAKKGHIRKWVLRDNIADIRKRLKAGETIASIAAEYGVYDTAVWKIKHGVSYANIS